MQVSVCTKCGARYEGEVKFCGLDGAVLVRHDIKADSASTGITYKSCPTCTRQYPAQARFCGADGTPLELKRQTNVFPVPGNRKDALRSFDPQTAGGISENRETGTVISSKNKNTDTVPSSGKRENSAQDKTAAASQQASLAAAAAENRETGTVVSATKKSPQTAPFSLVEDDDDDDFPSNERLIGKTLDGKYRIDSVLAEGGMAVLYLAQQMGIDRTVVVKVVHDSLISRPEAIQRFERECKVVGSLNHPNIVTVYDFGFVHKKQPYLVMEYIKGMPLSTRIEKQGPPPVDVAGRIISQICAGLEEAHRAGIIHRDLKPDNIILQDKTDRPDWVKIVDFGIAHLLDGSAQKRLTRTGRIVGTPEYMSPEQFSDKPLDQRSDIYCLGVVIFELLTGAPPYESSDIGVLMAKHLQLTGKPPSVSEYRTDINPGSNLDLLVRKCLEKEPSNRFQTVAELRKAIPLALSDRTS